MTPHQRPRHATRPFSTVLSALHGRERAARSVWDWRWRRAYHWGQAVAVGVLAGLLGFGLNWCTEALQYLRFKAAAVHIGPGGGFLLPWLAFTGCSSALASVAGLGVTLLAPVAAGSGIPQMKAWLNGVAVPGAVAPLTLLVKAVGVVFSISGGLVAGQEGPYIDSGGILGVLVGGAGSGAVRRWARRRLRQWGADGAAPPVAAPADAASKAQPLSSASTDGSYNGKAEGEEENTARKSSRVNQGSSSSNGSSDSSSSSPLPAWVPALAAVEPRELSDYGSVGTCAGVAVAFYAPVAGVVYAAEEGSTIFSATMLWRACVSAGCAVAALQIVAAVARSADTLGWMPLSVPTISSFTAVQQSWATFWWYAWELPFLCLLGVAGGMLGALWSAAVCRLLALRARFIPPGKRLLRVAEVVLVAAVTATVWIGVSYASPCQPLPPEDTQADIAATAVLDWTFFESPATLFPRLWCPEGELATWGQIFFMPLEGAVKALFTARQPGPSNEAAPDEDFLFAPSALAIFFAAAFPGLLLTYGIAAPTGIFIPTLAIGGAFGRLAGRGMQAVLNACGFGIQVSLPAWWAVGGASLLAGNTRLLLTTVLIVSETSGCTPVLVPVILAATLAKLAADGTVEEVYACQMWEAGYAFLEEGTDLKPTRLQEINREQVVELLHSSAHDFVPVVSAAESGGSSQIKQQQQAEQQGRAAQGAAGPAGSSSSGGDGGQGERELVGTVFRWQLLSLLAEPQLLNMLLLPAAEETGQRAGGAESAAGAAAADADDKQPGENCRAGQGAVAVPLPASAAERMPRQQRLVMLSLLAHEPQLLSSQQEAAILGQYAGSALSSNGEQQDGRQQAAGDGAPAAEPNLPPLAGLLDRKLDLGPLLHYTMFSVPPEGCLKDVQNVLRHTGSHSLVVQRRPRLAGVVTRQDLPCAR